MATLNEYPKLQGFLSVFVVFYGQLVLLVDQLISNLLTQIDDLILAVKCLT